MPLPGQRTAESGLVRAEPLNRETPRPDLDAALTPRHFVRNHLPVPAHVTSTVAIGGAVARPLSLELAELRGLGGRGVAVTLECAGNGRLGLAPLPPGEPWGEGAVSTALWTGVPLRRVLERAGLRDDVVEILAVGSDHGVVKGGPGPIAFERSLPLEKALDPDTLIAWEMNGRPLPREHGGPLRLIVPGWYGVASVKWLARLEARTEPFTGFFQTQRYVIDGRPCGPVRVKSLITRPGPGSRLARGELTVEGWAWSAAEVTGVEVSVDGGDRWVEAKLEPALGRHAWRRFRASVLAEEAGRHVLRSRARDASGESQPDAPRWNALGYENDAVTPVVFDVE